MSERADPEGFGYWYDEKQGDEGDNWHRTLIDPGLFARIGTLRPGTRVLDLGCGNGYLSRRLARAGALVVGVDRSSELIERARERERTEPLGVVYVETDAADLGRFGDAEFDLGVANMSLIDIEDAGRALQELGRVIRSGGRLVASISHPCFDVDTRSHYELDASASPPTVYRAVAGYRSPHSDRYPWVLPEGRTVWTVGYHRPLSWYVKVLRTAGFVLLDVEEPSPLAGFASQRFPADWVAQIPLHLVLEARREPGNDG